MSKKKAKKLKNSDDSKVMQNAQAEIDTETIENSLSDAIGVPQFSDIDSTQISQADTLFKGLRWYMVSNMRQLLSQMYTEIGLIKTIVDVPVEDAMRGGLDIKTKHLDQDEIQDLVSTMDQEDDLGIAAQAMKWNRLFGGGAVLVITGQDYSTPLDHEDINEDTLLEFRAVDMWELYWGSQNTSNRDEDLSRTSIDTEYYDYYGLKLHNSRVFLMKGDEAPSFIRPRLRGWGVSVVETFVRSINQYLKATDLMFEVLDEFKLDIFKIKGLTSALMHKNGAQKIRDRTALANYQKNYQNAITMDGEDDYVQKQLSFAGLGEAMTGIRMQVASDLRMPLTKIFGISASGFSSGEDDIENYNATVESSVRAKSKSMLLKVVKMRCMKKFGFVPDDMTIEFQSLRILSSEQEEAVKSQKFARVMQARTAGELTRDEFREACNKDDLLPMPLDLDVKELDLPQEPKEGEKPASPPAAAAASATKSPDAPPTKNSFKLFKRKKR